MGKRDTTPAGLNASETIPKVARASQPWALGFYPLWGISLKEFVLHSGGAGSTPSAAFNSTKRRYCQSRCRPSRLRPEQDGRRGGSPGGHRWRNVPGCLRRLPSPPHGNRAKPCESPPCETLPCLSTLAEPREPAGDANRGGGRSRNRERRTPHTPSPKCLEFYDPSSRPAQSTAGLGE